MEMPLPFLLRFVQPVAEKRYHDAMSSQHLLARTYDPITQTSSHSDPICTGTSLTYDETWFGSDTAQTDT